MKLSAPIYVLKNQAKKLKIAQEISMSQALDLIAQNEGYNSWSLLMAKSKELLPRRYDQLMEYFNPGDLIMVGARPFEGKTTFVTGLFVQAIHNRKEESLFFSLSEVKGDIEKRMVKFDSEILNKKEGYEINYSDDISADYVIDYCKERVSNGSIIVIDYLQLLDQKREKAPLQQQVESLKVFARQKECIIIFIAQLDRGARGADRRIPCVSDINLPNPLDLNLINKMIFLHRHQRNSARTEVILAGKRQHSFFVDWNRKYMIFLDFKKENTVVDPYERKVLESFFIDGRLSKIPVKRKKRVVILKHILKSFDRNKRYSEIEVNQIILKFHEDYCLIRREFICEQMMAREREVYWVLSAHITEDNVF